MEAERSPSTAYQFDRFVLSLEQGVLRASDGVELPLRPKSFALLRLFVENAGRLLDRDAIMSAIWPDVFVTDDSITQCVGDIRRALSHREKFFDLQASEVMTKNPVSASPEMKASEALALMENRPSQISVLPVVNHQGHWLGLIRLHDLLQSF